MMKIIKDDTKREKTAIRLDLKVSVLNQATEAAKKAGISRQRLIAAILEQVLNDPKFVLKVE